MIKSCPNFTGFIVGRENDVTKVVRARCGSWSCDYCASLNAMTWMYRIKDTIENQNAWSFVTFTSPSRFGKKRVGTEMSLKVCQDGWRKFREALRYKRGGKKFRYLRVYEIQDNGRYHIHAILEHVFDDIRTANAGKENEYTYSRWQKDNVKKWGFGFMCNAQNFTRRGSDWTVARYIAKYLTKGDERIGDGVRRFQASHGFAKTRASDSEVDWKMMNDFTENDLFHELQWSDMVIDVSAGNAITYDEVNIYQTYAEYIKNEQRNDTIKKPDDDTL